MQLSIVICTHNRAADLDLTLQSLTQAVAETQSAVEALVVANASSDDTVEICHRAGIRCHEEPRLGLSHARNAGIAQTTGDAILWLDDDVTLHPGFLDRYLTALQDHPDSAFFGGPIEPVLQGTPPDWARTALELMPGVWAGINLGDTDRDLDPRKNQYPYGANMLIRRAALGDGFRTDLGRKGNGLVGGEESALFQSFSERGLSGRWVSDAKVTHRIGPERQTLDYIARYFVGQGIQSERIRSNDARSETSARLRGRIRVAEARVTHVLSRLDPDPKRWLRTYAALHKAKGRSIARQAADFRTLNFDRIYGHDPETRIRPRP